MLISSAPFFVKENRIPLTSLVKGQLSNNFSMPFDADFEGPQSNSYMADQLVVSP